MLQTPNEIMNVVDKLDSGDHVVLFHENSEYARTIEFRFLNEGLKRGEYCVYSTVFDEPAEIERQMQDFGIDVKGPKERDLLHIYKLPASPAVHAAGGLQGIEEFTKTVLPESSDATYRLVGRLYPLDMLSKQHLAENLNIERKSQDGYKKRHGIAMCSYSTKHLKSELLFDWFAGALKAHDAAAFAPSPGNGTAFYMK